MIELIISLFTESIPDASVTLGIKVVKAIYPNGNIGENSMLSGVIGFVTYVFIISTVISNLIIQAT